MCGRSRVRSPTTAISFFFFFPFFDLCSLKDSLQTFQKVKKVKAVKAVQVRFLQVDDSLLMADVTLKRSLQPVLIQQWTRETNLVSCFITFTFKTFIKAFQKVWRLTLRLQRSKKGKKEKKRHCNCGGSNQGSLTYETDALTNVATWTINVKKS